jgi:peptide/nickel transport system permease protein
MSLDTKFQVYDSQTVSTEGTNRNNLAEAVRRYGQNRMAVVGLVIIVLFVVVAVFAPLIVPYEPDAQVISDRLQPPSRQYLMGTDKLGRDIFSRSIMAARISLPIGLFSMTISMVLGVGIGVVAGYFGGVLDNVLMRITDLFLSFPTFFLLITIAALFGPKISTIIMMLGVTSWGSTARIMRGVVLSIREMGYVEAARALGAGSGHIIVRHILLNSLSVIMVTATLMVAYAILVEGALSYLGLGVQPPTPSWGNMMSDGRDVLRVAWWPSLFPGFLLMLVVISFNLVGDGLRDFFDPAKQSRGGQ